MRRMTLALSDKLMRALDIYPQFPPLKLDQ